MNCGKLLVALVAPTFVVPLIYCQDAPSLADIARQNRAQTTDKTTTPAKGVVSSTPAARVDGPIAAQTSTTGTQETGAEADPQTQLHLIENYQNSIRSSFDQELFEKLDRLADEARSTKARLPGGFWALHLIYVPLKQPADGTDASEAIWTAHLDRLKRWVAQRPQSITARVALAGAYLQFGWKARGNGFADSVTEEGWRLFRERVGLAAQTLVDASLLPNKCPELYLTMQSVARSQERGKDVFTAIFDKAVAFEPDYQYFYRAQAESLLPKWGGEPGEMAAFAARTVDRLGGKRGDIIYYQIGIFVNCYCEADRDLNGMSWPRLKSGFAASEELYGKSILNANKMASFAAMVGDAAYAQQLFTRIGENWDQETWKTRSAFQIVREWARDASAASETEAALKAADENQRTPDGLAFDVEVSKAFDQIHSSVVAECLKSTGEPYLMPFDLVMQVGPDGRVEKALATIVTRTSTCIGTKAQTTTLPPPPKPAYWVKVAFQMQR